MVKINIDFPEELHKRAKSTAALNGELLKNFIINSVKKRLEE